MFFGKLEPRLLAIVQLLAIVIPIYSQTKDLAPYFDEIVVPMTGGMVLGQAYDARTQTPFPDQVFGSKEKATPNFNGASTNYTVTTSDSSLLTDDELKSDLKLKVNALLSNAKVNANFSQGSVFSEKQGTLHINYYVTSQFYGYSLDKTGPDNNLTIPAMTHYALLKHQFDVDKSKGNLAEFYNSHGTHVIIGYQNVHSVTIEANALDTSAKIQNELDAYASARYAGLSFQAGVTRFHEAFDRNSRFTFHYVTHGASKADIPPFPIPPNAEELIGPDYISRVNTFIMGQIQNPDKSTDLTGRDVAVCAPYSQLFGEGSDSPQTAMELSMLDDFAHYEAIVGTLHHLQIETGFPFWTQKKGNTAQDVQAVVDEANERLAKLGMWLHEITTSPTAQRLSNITKQVYDLSPLPEIEIPRLRLQPSSVAIGDSVAIWVTLLVPKGPFLIQTYDENANKHQLLDVLGPSPGSERPQGPPWLLIQDNNDSRQVSVCAVMSDPAHQAWPAQQASHIGQSFRVDLVLNGSPTVDGNDSTVSTVVAQYTGQ